MLALFNIFARSYTGWTRLTTVEGIQVLFPQNATRATSVAETPLGTMHCTLYSGHWLNSNASSILSIRDYQSETTLDPYTLFNNWKAEFIEAMEVSGVRKHRIKQSVTEGKYTRCDLLYTNNEETTYTRVCLVAAGNRLIILFTVGMLQEVLTPACSECYSSIKLQ